MAYKEGQSQPNVIPLLVDAAALGAKEIVNWIGSEIQGEAKKHSAQFAAFIQEPDWWVDNAPVYAAVELTRTRPDQPGKATLFDAIVVIRPVMGSAHNSGRPVAFQLVPVYLLETTAAAEDFAEKMGAVMNIHLESNWVSNSGDPVHAVLIDYPVTVKEYDLGQAYLFVGKDGKQSESSPFFAMPERESTVSVKFGFVETDPSKWVDFLDKLGAAISGQSSNASSAVQSALTPKS